MCRLLLLGTSMAVGLLMVGLSGHTGTWAAEELKPGPDYKHLKVLEWLIGDWEAEMEIPPGFQEIHPNGATVHSRKSCHWMQDKNYIGFEFRNTADGELVHEGFEMAGVDPKSKNLVQWIFSVAGGNGTGTWSRHDKGWKLEWSATLPNGAKYKGTAYLVATDKNTHTWTMRNLTRNGKKIPDYPLVTFRRVGSKKAEK